MQIADFLDHVLAWVESRPDVLGLAIVGSYARGAARADSDVDLVILCEDPKGLVDRDDWIARFGEPLETVPEEYGVVRALRVFYRDGPEAEFGLNPLAWAEVPLDAGTRRVISDGIRILYDPAGLLKKAEIEAAARPGVGADN